MTAATVTVDVFKVRDGWRVQRSDGTTRIDWARVIR